MSAVALLIASSIVAATQAGTPSVAGTWTAQFEGRTFIRLELRTTKGVVSGAIGIGSFEVDDRGMLKRVDSVPSELKPISGAAQRDSILAFALDEGDEPDRFELRLLEGGRAELHLVLSPEDREDLAASGIGVPRPIVLIKQ